MPQGNKLRAPPLERPFQVVLVEPEIPPNTGAVARTCAATRSPLHLVGPLGFRIDEASVRRAGIDYWHLVEIHRHSTLHEFAQTHAAEGRQARLHLFASAAKRSYLDADFQPGDALVFGKESVGLAPELIDAYPDRVWAIPTLGPVRSLNLSNAVSIVLYEALRAVNALSTTYSDPTESDRSS